MAHFIGLLFFFFSERRTRTIFPPWSVIKCNLRSINLHCDFSRFFFCLIYQPVSVWGRFLPQVSYDRLSFFLRVESLDITSVRERTRSWSFLLETDCGVNRFALFCCSLPSIIGSFRETCWCDRTRNRFLAPDINKCFFGGEGVCRSDVRRWWEMTVNQSK